MAREDYYTNTVEDAADFERHRAMDEGYDEYPGYAGPDYDPRDDEEYDPNEEPECNCSDPGCPCGGWKIGGL